MIIITPQSSIQNIKENSVKCFLGGGITNCRNWQNEVIDCLNDLSKVYDLSDLVILNPRRQNFDINKIKAEDQIKWQFINIQKSNLFSMFFCGGTDSPQPICFFEYGKQLVERANRLGTLICTVEKDFVRFEDVCVQTHLMYPTSQIVTFESDDYIKTHAQSIVDAYNRFQMNKLSNLWSYK